MPETSLQKMLWNISYVIQGSANLYERAIYLGAKIAPEPIIINEKGLPASENPLGALKEYVLKYWSRGRRKLLSRSYVRSSITEGPKGLQLSRYHAPNAIEHPFFELLLSHKSKKSFEPRDKIYALIGISNSRKSFGQNDYSLSVRQVYTTARHKIHDSRRLDIIYVNQKAPDGDDLHSWVPDWKRPPQSRQPTIIGLRRSEPQFMASGDSYANAQFLQDIFVSRTTGVIIGRVQETGLSFRRELNCNNSGRGLVDLQEWWNIVVSKKGHSLEEQGAFCRTISCVNHTFDNDSEYALRMNSIATALSEQLPQLEFSLYPSSTEESIDEKQRLAVLISTCLSMNRRRFIISNTGIIIALGPLNISKDDLICILPGCRFPVILRKIDDPNILLGETYIDGFRYVWKRNA
ncbi:hypothetical protein NHQ30_011121 [Ciborinia camelliae]|nr:hypothetical protein NHQ30_011121 [Ciborinia camelliae]